MDDYIDLDNDLDDYDDPDEWPNVWYNSICLNEQNTGAFCFPDAAAFSQSDIVGKAPSWCGLSSSAVRLGNGSTLGGRFVMDDYKPKFSNPYEFPPYPFPDTQNAPIRFKLLEDFPWYGVDTEGVVYQLAIRKGRFAWWPFGPYRNGNTDHAFVRLYRDGEMYKKYIHRLVLEVFVGQCPKGMECCHNDGNASNNKLSNLRWDTRRSNVLDAQKHGAKPVGSNLSWAKLTEDVIKNILHLYSEGLTPYRIAKRLGLDPSSVNKICKRKRWKYV